MFHALWLSAANLQKVTVILLRFYKNAQGCQCGIHQNIDVGCLAFKKMQKKHRADAKSTYAIKTGFDVRTITVAHIVNVPAWGSLCRHGQWLASHRYRDAEGLIVQSSAASTLSALCSTCRTLAGLHTVL